MKKFVFLLLLFRTIPTSAMLIRLVALHAKPRQVSRAQINNRSIKVPRRICTTMTEQRGQKVDFKEIDQKLKDAQKKEIRALCRSVAWKTTLVLTIPPLMVPTIVAGGLFGAASLCCFAATPVWIINGDLDYLKYTVAAYAGFLMSCGAYGAEFALADYIEAKGEENYKEATIQRDLVEVLKKQREGG